MSVGAQSSSSTKKMLTVADTFVTKNEPTLKSLKTRHYLLTNMKSDGVFQYKYAFFPRAKKQCKPSSKHENCVMSKHLMWHGF